MNDNSSQNVELSEFVSQTITAIIEGVSRSAGAVKEKGGLINPTISEINSGVSSYNLNHIRQVQYVEFDLAVSASHRSSNGAGLDVGVVQVFRVGGKTQSEEHISSENRVRFSIPISLPTIPEDKDKQNDKSRIEI